LDIIDFSRNLAVVGSRLCSTNAKIALANILSGFKNTNITIVSGLARGIDSTAHLAAIDNNLKTIAVVASGLDIIYPSENKKLFNDIIEKFGVVFSEFPLKTSPQARNFPQRNRIVVGLSKGTLVAEAKIQSGAMISARLTLEYNRELMAMPGAITNPNTSGVYKLIKQGAGIVVEAGDILEQLNWTIENKEVANTVSTNLSENDKLVLKTLELEAKNFDEIIEEITQEVEADISKIMISLTELEIKGLIKQINNKYYKI